MDTLSMPLEKEHLESVLPHRDPFLWVTRVIACEPGESISAEFDVSPDLPLFKGHFPGYPVFPGVLIMEALAQASCFCILVARDAHNSIGFLTGIENAKFRNQVRPGDILQLESRIVKSSSRMCVAEVRASIGEKICATAVQKYVLSDEGMSEISS